MFHVQPSKKINNKKIGNYGETIACNYLKRNGFVVLERNYLKKWGEIDIVARATFKNEQIVHFVEVKSVSYETRARILENVSRGTWRPEENVTRHKLRKLARVIESWILENNYSGKWQIDVVAVKLVMSEKYASVKYIPNVIA